MRLKILGRDRSLELEADLLVVEADNGTPVAIVMSHGPHVMVTTADEERFAELAKDLSLPVPEVEELQCRPPDKSS